MENNSSFDSFELQLTNEAQDYLRTTAKWAMFLAVLGFIGLAFMLIGGLIMLAAGSAMSSATASMGGTMGNFSSSVVGPIYIVMAILYFFPILYLYKFASKTKQALANSNTADLTESLKNLKSHYKFVGILTIVVMVGYFIGAILMVAFLASSM